MDRRLPGETRVSEGRAMAYLATTAARCQGMRDAIRVPMFPMFVAIWCLSWWEFSVRPWHMATKAFRLVEDNGGLHWVGFNNDSHYFAFSGILALKVVVSRGVAWAGHARGGGESVVARSHNVRGELEALSPRFAGEYAVRYRGWPGRFTNQFAIHYKVYALGRRSRETNA